MLGSALNFSKKKKKVNKKTQVGSYWNFVDPINQFRKNRNLINTEYFNQ